MKELRELADFLKNYVIECNPIDGCQRCDEARIHLKNLNKFIEQPSAPANAEEEKQRLAELNKDSSWKGHSQGYYYHFIEGWEASEEYHRLASQPQKVSDEEILEWYAEERDMDIEEFDDIDLGNCKWIGHFVSQFASQVKMSDEEIENWIKGHFVIIGNPTKYSEQRVGHWRHGARQLWRALVEDRIRSKQV